MLPAKFHRNLQKIGIKGKIIAHISDFYSFKDNHKIAPVSSSPVQGAILEIDKFLNLSKKILSVFFTGQPVAKLIRPGPPTIFEDLLFYEFSIHCLSQWIWNFDLCI